MDEIKSVENDEIVRETEVEELSTEETIETEETVEDKAEKELTEKPVVTDESDKIIEIAESISGLSEKIEQMNTLFAQRIQRTEYEEKIMDQMHSELQKYKDDMYSQLIRPILLDIIDVRESIRHLADVFRAKPEDERYIPLNDFSLYTYDMGDILEKNNVTIFDSKCGDDFTPTKHKVIGTIETSDKGLDRKIADSLSSGYEYNGRFIVSEKVAVYKYVEQEEQEKLVEESVRTEENDSQRPIEEEPKISMETMEGENK